MKAKYIASSVIALPILLLVASVGFSQELDEHLLMLQPLTGFTWGGHFVESSDSGLVHVVRWEPILNGNVIRSTKEVTALNFRMETLYYWDWEKETISFLQLTSRGIFSRGTVALAENRITLLGRGIRPDGISEFKQTFEIRPDGTLQDCFYRRDDGEWVQGHQIVYTRQENPAE
jgi:hypothetical protein